MDERPPAMWLGMDEVDRLRALLWKLEWAAPLTWMEGDETAALCPACWRGRGDGHDSDCWLAEELRRMREQNLQ